jgi:type I restriction enzyme S subunit
MSWEKVDFKTAVKDITGGNRKFQGFEYNQEGHFPIIDQGDGLIAGYTDEKNIVRRAKEVVVFGDHTKSLKYVDFDFCLGADGVKVLQPYDQLDSKFFYYYLKTINLPNVGYSRHYKFLKELQIPLPPLPIQKRIAEILDAADALKRKDQELLKKYDELAEAIFIDMFGDPVRNEKGWEVKNIGSQMRSIRYGTGSPPIYCSIGIPFIRATNIKNGRVEEKGMVYVNEEEANKIKKCYLNEGDLLIVRSGANTGDCAYITDEYSNSLGGFDLIIEMENVKSRFYNFFINSIWGKAIIEKLSRRAGQPHLNSEQVSNIECILPSYGKLQTFKLIIDNLELTRKQIVNSRLKNNDLFNSLIQKAFKEELVS